MLERRWTNQSQPQTLQGAVLFSYLNAGLALLYTLILGLQLYLLVFVLLAVAAYAIANDRKWGYRAAVVLGGLYLLSVVAALATGGSLGGVLDLLFAGVLMVMLLHPDSRSYQRIWFH